jgi:HSP20 family molecular chaperone IbpA
MSIIPSFVNNRSHLMEPFFGGQDPFFKASLDLFDPFDQLDRDMSRNLHWFLKPEFPGELPFSFPHVPQKYRITVDCSGFSPQSIKTEVVDKNKVVVTALEEHRVEGTDDFSTKHFKKTYKLPENAVTEQMVSFMTGNGHFVIEVPLRETETHKASDLLPQIVDAKDGSGKQVTMKFNVPQHIDPSKINVSVKGHHIVFKADDEVKQPDRVSKYHYFQRTTLPEGTQFDNLRCHLEKNKVVVTAPIIPLEHGKTSYRKVPIEGWPTQQTAIKQ